MRFDFRPVLMSFLEFQKEIPKLTSENLRSLKFNCRKILKDLSKVKPGFKSVPLQIYFEIAEQTKAKKWREIQNLVGEECF